MGGMSAITMLLKAAPVVNRGVVALLASPRWGARLAKNLTVITYTGRRSGRTISIPVGYTRRGDELEITVVAPDEKRWWRNFTGEGGVLMIGLDGGQRSGHAVAERQSAWQATVTVRLTPG